MTRKTKKTILYILTCLIIVYSITSRCTSQRSSKCTLQVPASIEIPLFTKTRPEQRITHTGYTVSYNPEWKIPNWVAYELTATEVQGTVPRAEHFTTDPDVKGICADPRDYTDSGYDRGHMAPAADMKWSQQAMDESFYMTNICPQNRNLNRGDWNILEEHTREWASAFQNLYIVCGPIVTDQPKTIGENKVAIPDAFFKVLLCQNNGRWQAIGFLYSNKSGKKSLAQYCRSIDEIESITDIDFFSTLPDSTERIIEASYDLTLWRI